MGFWSFLNNLDALILLTTYTFLVFAAGFLTGYQFMA